MPRKFQSRLLAAIGLILLLVGEYYDNLYLVGLGSITIGLLIYLYKDIMNKQETAGMTELARKKRLRLNAIGFPIMSAVFIIAGIYFIVFGDFTFRLWPN